MLVRECGYSGSTQPSSRRLLSVHHVRASSALLDGGFGPLLPQWGTVRVLASTSATHPTAHGHPGSIAICNAPRQQIMLTSLLRPGSLLVVLIISLYSLASRLIVVPRRLFSAQPGRHRPSRISDPARPHVCHHDANSSPKPVSFPHLHALHDTRWHPLIVGTSLSLSASTSPRTKWRAAWSPRG